MNSKDIADYIKIKLTDIKVEMPLPFDIFIYFPRNERIILCWQTDSVPNLTLLENYYLKGLRTFWVRKEDEALFKHYLISKESKVNEMSSESNFIGNIIKTPSLTPDEKREVLKVAAKELLRRSADAVSLENRAEAEEAVRLAVEDILSATTFEVKHMVSEVWKFSSIDADLNHAATVSAYAVLFAVAAGTNDWEFLGHVALAGLLHEVGLAKIAPSIASIPLQQLNKKSKPDFVKHVEEGARIIEKYATDIPINVKQAIEAHHARLHFDNDHQPNINPETTIIGELLTLADLITSISNGHWDGTTRSIKDTLGLLGEMMKTSNFFKNFNRNIFDAVIEWVHESTKAEINESINEATKAVKEKVKEVVS